MISIIVAYDENRVIGNKGKMPWLIPDDMGHFKDTTMGHTVVMGRKTWDSLPERFKPLYGRLNIVLTRQDDSYFDIFDEHVCVAKSFEQAASMHNRETFIIGGGEIYKQALEMGIVDRVIASEVKGEHEGDTHFPKLEGVWHAYLRKEFDKFNVVEYSKSPLSLNPFC